MQKEYRAIGDFPHLSTDENFWLRSPDHITQRSDFDGFLLHSTEDLQISGTTTYWPADTQLYVRDNKSQEWPAFLSED
jgi:hypothetical protein